MGQQLDNLLSKYMFKNIILIIIQVDIAIKSLVPYKIIFLALILLMKPNTRYGKPLINVGSINCTSLWIQSCLYFPKGIFSLIFVRKFFKYRPGWIFLVNRKDLSNIQIYNLIFLFCLLDNFPTQPEGKRYPMQAAFTIQDLGQIINFASSIP